MQQHLSFTQRQSWSFTNGILCNCGKGYPLKNVSCSLKSISISKHLINSIWFPLPWVKYKFITSCFKKKKKNLKTYLGSVSKPELKVTSGFPSRVVVVLLCGVSREECGTVRDDLSGSREPFDGLRPQHPPWAFPMLLFSSAPLDLDCSLCFQGSEIMSCAQDDFESKSSSWGLSCWPESEGTLPGAPCPFAAVQDHK